MECAESVRRRACVDLALIGKGLLAMATLVVGVWLLGSDGVSFAQATRSPVSTVEMLESGSSKVPRASTEIRIRPSATTAPAAIANRSKPKDFHRKSEPRRETQERGTTLRLVEADPVLTHLGALSGDSRGVQAPADRKVRADEPPVARLALLAGVPGRNGDGSSHATELHIGSSTSYRSVPGRAEWTRSVAPDDTFRVTAGACRVMDGSGRITGKTAQSPAASRISANDSPPGESTVRVVSYDDEPAVHDTKPARRIFAAAAPFARPSAPQRIGPFQVVADHVERLAMAPGQSKLLRSQVDVHRTAVGDPGLCKLLHYSSREVLITGKREGTTRVTFWFKDGAHPPVTCLLHVTADPAADR